MEKMTRCGVGVDQECVVRARGGGGAICFPARGKQGGDWVQPRYSSIFLL